MSFACYYYAAVTWPAFSLAISSPIQDNSLWPHPGYRALVSFSWILAAIIGLAIVALTSWQVYLVRTGLTTVDYYQWKDAQEEAKPRGIEVANFWDLGTWKRNAEWFFYIGKVRGWWSILFPIPVPARTDGTWWPTSYDVKRAAQLPSL